MSRFRTLRPFVTALVTCGLLFVATSTCQAAGDIAIGTNELFTLLAHWNHPGSRDPNNQHDFSHGNLVDPLTTPVDFADLAVLLRFWGKTMFTSKKEEQVDGSWQITTDPTSVKEFRFSMSWDPDRARLVGDGIFDPQGHPAFEYLNGYQLPGNASNLIIRQGFLGNIRGIHPDDIPPQGEVDVIRVTFDDLDPLNRESGDVFRIFGGAADFYRVTLTDDNGVIVGEELYGFEVAPADNPLNLVPVGIIMDAPDSLIIPEPGTLALGTIAMLFFVGCARCRPRRVA